MERAQTYTTQISVHQAGTKRACNGFLACLRHAPGMAYVEFYIFDNARCALMCDCYLNIKGLERVADNTLTCRLCGLGSNLDQAKHAAG